MKKDTKSGGRQREASSKKGANLKGARVVLLPVVRAAEGGIRRWGGMWRQ